MNKIVHKFFSLRDKNIWVFGGAGYLGQATVELLQAMGAKVLCIDMGNRAETFLRSSNLGLDVVSADLDVRDGEAIKQFVTKHIKMRGIPDGLVNLTYTSTAKKLEELSEAEFDSVNHGNLTATFLLSREIGLEMVKVGRGSIILFSSILSAN